MSQDKRRRDNLCWFIEVKFRKGSEYAEDEGVEWGAYSGGFKSKTDAVQELRFERREARGRGESKDVKFRVRGVDGEVYKRIFATEVSE